MQWFMVPVMQPWRVQQLDSSVLTQNRAHRDGFAAHLAI